MSSVKVTIKPTSGGDKFQAEIEASATIRELKEVVARKCDTAADSQRLIYKGQVLKDDRTVDSYGIQSEHVLHMVKGRAQGTTSSTSTTGSSAAASAPPSSGAASSTPMGSGGDLGLGGLGLGGMNMANPEQMQQAMSQMMNNPMMQSVLNDPEMLRNMFSSNPAIQQLMDRNPEFAQVLNNPQQLQEAMQAASNPALMREQMRNQDRTMANIESHPEGFNALRRMYENFQEPLMDAAGQGNSQQDPLAALLGGAAAGGNASTGGAASTPGSTDAAASSAPNTAPLPNPWAPSSGGNAGAAPAGMGGLAGLAGMGGMEGLAGLGGMGGAGGGAPDMGAMLQMLQQPGVQQALQGVLSNPQMMQTMMNANPHMRAMMEQNPQVREVMSNPEQMRQMLNPQNMQAMIQMQQAVQQLQGSGLVPPGAGGLPGLGGAGGDMSGLAALLGGGGGGGFGGFGGGGGGVPPVADPETAYASQLTQLQDMGFGDRPANIRALQAVSGNVNAAVERLLSGL